MSERSPAARGPARWRRHRTLAAALALAAALGGAWQLWRGAAGPPPPAGSTAMIPPAATLPPAPDAAVPPLLLPPPAAVPAPPPQSGAAPTPSPEVPPPSAATPTPPAHEAYEPELASADTDLSHARRAGLQHAADPVGLTASAALALDADSGAVLYAKNEHAILPIASLTKLLAGIVLLEARLPLAQRIRIDRADVDTLRHSRSRLRVGTTLTRREALRLALMSSENRAAHALARTYPGGVPAFVAAMNERSATLGMQHARFADPTGLSNANRATARDVAVLVAAAARYPLLRSFSTTPRYQAAFQRRKLQYLNSNRLVRQRSFPILLQKTGYIVEAGQCLALATRIRGRTVVLVLLDSGSVLWRGRDARTLRRWLVRQDQPA